MQAVEEQERTTSDFRDRASSARHPGGLRDSQSLWSGVQAPRRGRRESSPEGPLARESDGPPGGGARSARSSISTPITEAAAPGAAPRPAAPSPQPMSRPRRRPSTRRAGAGPAPPVPVFWQGVERRQAGDGIERCVLPRGRRGRPRSWGRQGHRTVSTSRRCAMRGDGALPATLPGRRSRRPSLKRTVITVQGA